MLLFTDGVNETIDRQGRRYGRQRLRATAGALQDVSAQGLCDRLLEEAAAFRGEVAQQDDITVVAFKVPA